MKVSVKELLKVLKELPKPTNSKQNYYIRIPERLSLLNYNAYVSPKMNIKVNEFILTPIKYRNNFHTWYEWEIEIG